MRMSRIVAFSSTFWITLVGMAAIASSASITLEPADDSSWVVDASGGSSPGGTLTRLTVGFDSAEGTEFRSALEFDLSGIPSGSEITSAILGGRGVLAQVYNGMDIGVFSYFGDGFVTPSDFLVVGNLETVVSLPSLQFGSYDLFFDVTHGVRDIFAATSFAGFMFADLYPLDELVELRSIESESPLLLTIEYESAMVPEPSALFLLGTGLLSLVGFARRRRR